MDSDQPVAGQASLEQRDDLLIGRQVYPGSGPASGGGTHPSARNLPGAVALRDSKDPAGPALVFTRDEWETFGAGVKRGEFDLP